MENYEQVTRGELSQLKKEDLVTRTLEIQSNLVERLQDEKLPVSCARRAKTLVETPRPSREKSKRNGSQRERSTAKGADSDDEQRRDSKRRRESRSSSEIDSDEDRRRSRKRTKHKSKVESDDDNVSVPKRAKITTVKASDDDLPSLTESPTDSLIDAFDSDFDVEFKADDIDREEEREDVHDVSHDPTHFPFSDISSLPTTPLSVQIEMAKWITNPDPTTLPRFIGVNPLEPEKTNRPHFTNVEMSVIYSFARKLPKAQRLKESNWVMFALTFLCYRTPKQYVNRIRQVSSSERMFTRCSEDKAEKLLRYIMFLYTLNPNLKGAQRFRDRDPYGTLHKKVTRKKE